MKITVYRPSRTAVWLAVEMPSQFWFGWSPLSGVVWIDPTAPLGYRIGRRLSPVNAWREVRRRKALPGSGPIHVPEEG